MGIDAKTLPDSLLKRVSPEDRKVAGLPPPLSELISKAAFKSDANKEPKAHGAGYNLAVVLAYFADCGLPAPLPEYRFCSERKWRFDFAWPYIGGPYAVKETLVALEVQGGIFAKIPGGHNRGAKIRREHEKRNLAACLGWRILYCETETLCVRSTVWMIERALAWKPDKARLVVAALQ